MAKLVRDKIPQIITQSGEQAISHTASESEYAEALQAKLIEEVSEFLKDQNPEELADILEVIYALAKTNSITIEQLDEIRANKAQQKGSFDKKIILE